MMLRIAILAGFFASALAMGCEDRPAQQEQQQEPATAEPRMGEQPAAEPAEPGETERPGTGTEGMGGTGGGAEGMGGGGTGTGGME